MDLYDKILSRLSEIGFPEPTGFSTFTPIKEPYKTICYGVNNFSWGINGFFNFVLFCKRADGKTMIVEVERPKVLLGRGTDGSRVAIEIKCPQDYIDNEDALSEYFANALVKKMLSIPKICLINGCPDDTKELVEWAKGYPGNKTILYQTFNGYPQRSASGDYIVSYDNGKTCVTVKDVDGWDLDKLQGLREEDRLALGFIERQYVLEISCNLTYSGEGKAYGEEEKKEICNSCSNRWYCAPYRQKNNF